MVGTALYVSPEMMSGENSRLQLGESGSLGDGNLTGMVGTALYVSPEMMSGENKVTYSQVSLVVLMTVTWQEW